MSSLWHWISGFDGLMHTVVSLGVLFFLLTTLFLFLIIISKWGKRRKESMKSRHWERVKEHLAAITIHSQECNVEYERSKDIIGGMIKKSPILRQWVLEELIKQQSNVSGDSKKILKKLYVDLGLKSYSLNKLKSYHWYKVAKGVGELERMNQTDCHLLFTRFLTSRHKDLRIAARLAISSLAPDPLSFLDSVKDELSEWEQMELDLRLRGRNKDELPDFCCYYKHEEPSVVWFCVEMSVRFNYFEHIPQLIELMVQSEGELKKHVIRALGKLEAYQAIDSITSLIFPTQDEELLVTSLFFLSEVGDESCQEVILSCLDDPRTAVRMQAVDAVVKLDLTVKEINNDLLQMINHHKNELII